METTAKQIKTLADFKNALVKGQTQVHTIYHKVFAGRGEDGKAIWKEESKGIRTVSIKQSNSFALSTINAKGELVDSWCEYPKASQCKIQDGKVTIYESDGLPVLTYWIAEEII